VFDFSLCFSSEHRFAVERNFRPPVRDLRHFYSPPLRFCGTPPEFLPRRQLVMNLEIDFEFLASSRCVNTPPETLGFLGFSSFSQVLDRARFTPGVVDREHDVFPVELVVFRDFLDRESIICFLSR